MRALLPAAILAAALAAAMPPARAAESAPTLTVELRSAACAAGTLVRLDEVADLRGERAPLAGAVLLGRAPQAGRSRDIGREAVERRLIEEGFEAGSFTVAGAKESRVTSAEEAGAPGPAAQPVPVQEKEAPAAAVSPKERLAELVAERARTALAAVLGCPAADVEVRIEFAVEPAPAAGSGRTAIELRWVGGGPRLGRQRLEILPAAEKGADRKAAAPIAVALADLAVMRDALAVVRDLAAGEPITASDVQPVRVRTTDPSADFVKDAAELTGKAAARGLRAGAPVDRRTLGKLILVRRGQPVILVTESGPVRVTETAVSRSDGGLDDMVLVERLDSRKQLAGRVAGSGLVKTE